MPCRPGTPLRYCHSQQGGAHHLALVCRAEEHATRAPGQHKDTGQPGVETSYKHETPALTTQLTIMNGARGLLCLHTWPHLSTSDTCESSMYAPHDYTALGIQHRALHLRCPGC
jgi:hypothetical protein